MESFHLAGLKLKYWRINYEGYGELIMKELLVHIRSSIPFIHSDRIFGAICVAMNDFGEEKLIDMLENFNKEPPFLLSSVFPYIDYDGRTYFLPKPIEDIKKMDDHRKYIDNYKKLDSVKYISADIFNDWINGKTNEAYILQNLDKHNIKSGLLFPKEKILKFDIISYDTPRNRVNRLNNLSEDIFYFGDNSYKNVNLFFIIRIYDHKYEELLKCLLTFLKDYRGFGKDLSVGKGRFEIEEFSENKIFESPKDCKRFITLSRYIPSADEINMFKVRKEIYYDIVTKRGMMSGNKPKKQVRFFSEGSTFPNLKNIYGRILYVHEKAVEYGFAFNVGISYG